MKNINYFSAASDAYAVAADAANAAARAAALACAAARTPNALLFWDAAAGRAAAAAAEANDSWETIYDESMKKED